MDNVCIENLQTEAVIGVYAFEQQAPQPLLIDLELATDFTRAFASDHLQDALDYDAISQQVRAFCQQSRYALLEALAGGLIRLLLSEHSTIDQVTIRIRKPQALKGALASVCCRRSREQL